MNTFLLNAMTREELRNVAIILNVPRGQNKIDTVRNLDNAFRQGKARIQYTGTIVSNDRNGFDLTVFMKIIKPNNLVNKPEPVEINFSTPNQLVPAS